MQIQIDEYAHLDSWIHRWDPRYKLVAIACLIFAFSWVESLWLLPLMVTVTLGLYGSSRLPVSFLRQRLRYPGIFLLGIVLLLPWQAGETVVWQWGALALRQEGIVAVVLIACRFLCIITAGLVLLGTMSFLTTIKAMRALGLPRVLSDMTLLTYRYLFEITDNLRTMQRAMRLRGFTPGHHSGQSHRQSPRQRPHRTPHQGHSPHPQNQSRRRQLPSLRDINRIASLTGTLFIRSYEQSERIYNAMKLRGYGSCYQPQLSAIAPSTANLSRRGNVITTGATVIIAVGLVALEVAF